MKKKCPRDCDCCDATNSKGCECPYCHFIEAADKCTCKGSTATKGTFKITNPVLTAVDFAELFAAIDRDEVVEIDGDDPVYEIAAEALFGACCNMPKLETVKFNYVTNIGTLAFADSFKNCPNLKSVEFSRLEEAGVYAFSSAFVGSGLKALEFPKLRYAGGSAFGAAEVEAIRLPNLMHISTSLFSGNEKLRFVSARNAISIGTFAFYNCPNLQTVELHSVSRMIKDDDIDGYLFEGCKKLVSLELPAMTSLDHFLKNTFDRSSIKDLYLPVISSNAYAQAWAEHVSLPAGCTIHFSDGDVVYPGLVE